MTETASQTGWLRERLKMVKKAIHTMAKSFRYPVLLVPLVLAGQTIAQQNSFDDVLSEYEEKMDQAARNWIQKNYAKALDGFTSARELLSDNMPPSTETYEWEEARTLKTYTVVLARLTEVDFYRERGRIDQVIHVAKQAQEWSEVLNEQANGWAEVYTPDLEEASSRVRWIKRFLTAIRQTNRVCQEVLLEE